MNGFKKHKRSYDSDVRVVPCASRQISDAPLSWSADVRAEKVRAELGEKYGRVPAEELKNRKDFYEDLLRFGITKPSKPSPPPFVNYSPASSPASSPAAVGLSVDWRKEAKHASLS